MPKASEVPELGMTRTEYVTAIEEASQWIVDELRGAPEATSKNMVEKWHYVFAADDSRGLQYLKEGILRILVVDCWTDVAKLVYRRATEAPENLNSIENRRQGVTSTTEIWNNILSCHLSQLAPIPAVLELAELDIQLEELSQALFNASLWIVNNLFGVENDVAEEIRGKWRFLFYPQADDHGDLVVGQGGMRAWQLNILLVNAWIDVWTIIHGRQAGRIPVRSG